MFALIALSYRSWRHKTEDDVTWLPLELGLIAPNCLHPTIVGCTASTSESECLPLLDRVEDSAEEHCDVGEPVN